LRHVRRLLQLGKLARLLRLPSPLFENACLAGRLLGELLEASKVLRIGILTARSGREREDLVQFLNGKAL
jgi:hypothetical protein